MPDVISPCSPAVATKVTYEMRMFRYAYDKLAQLQVDMGNVLPGDVVPSVGTRISTEEVRAASVLLESFLIHARVLRDFFCPSPEPHKDDDVVASDFVSEWTQPPASDYPSFHAAEGPVKQGARTPDDHAREIRFPRQAVGRGDDES